MGEGAGGAARGRSAPFEEGPRAEGEKGKKKRKKVSNSNPGNLCSGVLIETGWG